MLPNFLTTSLSEFYIDLSKLHPLDLQMRRPAPSRCMNFPLVLERYFLVRVAEQKEG